MFVLQNAPSEVLELEGLSLSAVGSAGETAKFELTLALQEQGGVIVGGVEYNRDLYEAETIGRLMASYEQVLQAVVADAEQRVLEIELLSEAERRLLLQEWNDTKTEYPRETCIHELFASQVANTPSQVAIVHDGEQLSYAELNARANQLAHHLRAIGVKPGSPVGICIPPSIDMVVGLLGILKAGAAYIPLDPSYPRPRLSFILNDVKVLFLLTQPELLDTLPDHSARAICLDAERQAISEQSTDEPGVFISALSPAYIIYTSGSTGQPKGVQISHRAVVNFLTAMSRQPGLNHDDVLLAVTSLSFDIAGLELYLPLITGARLVLASREETMDGALLLKKLLQSGATAMQATPTTWRLLVAAGWQGPAPFKVLCGGEALPSDLAQELTKRSAEVWNLYGPTETTVWSTVQRLDHERDVTIGRPIANTQIYLLDDHLQAVSHRVPGQLYIGGAGLAIAYLNQPALTAERFVPNPFGTDGARLYQTGDLARYRLNGEIEYLGRLDQQVKIRGFRIELGEIEAVLSAHESLREAIVVARETASGDQQLVAYVVRDSDRKIGTGEAAADESRSKLVPTLRAYLKENLPEYMVPAEFVLLAKLPLTPNSKIDRRALQAMKIELDRRGESLIEPRDVVELQLAHIWEELLDVRHVGVRDDFFRLGGHSLLAVRLMARIQASFGQNLPLASLFQGATIEKQARLLREQQPDHSASLVAIQAKGEGLPFFCVHPGGGNVLCYQGVVKSFGTGAAILWHTRTGSA